MKIKKITQLGQLFNNFSFLCYDSIFSVWNEKDPWLKKVLEHEMRTLDFQIKRFSCDSKLSNHFAIDSPQTTRIYSEKLKLLNFSIFPVIIDKTKIVQLNTFSSSIAWSIQLFCLHLSNVSCQLNEKTKMNIFHKNSAS